MTIRASQLMPNSELEPPATASVPLEEYALIANHLTVALISRTGSVDWFCPQVDGDATFAALLGEPKHGRWQVTVAEGKVSNRGYLDNADDLILSTTWLSPTGTAEITDYLHGGTLVRTITCVKGDITIAHDLKIRTDYGLNSPGWKTDPEAGLQFFNLDNEHVYTLSGPPLSPSYDQRCIAADFSGTFQLSAGNSITWKLSTPSIPESTVVVDLTGECLPPYKGQWVRLAERSAMVINALSLDTGAVLAAATASLPEEFGGERNWDYRFCWLRDSALSIEALLIAGNNGYTQINVVERAEAWREWLINVIDTDNLQIVYGINGETDLEERILAHLPGYENSLPVRVGNGAASQYQADVVGELMLTLKHMRDAGIPETPESWELQKKLLDYCMKNYVRRDHGIWEMRGELHYFTHGRAMMWTAFDCAISAVEKHELSGDVDTWRDYRDQLRAEIFSRGFNSELNTFTQTYEGTIVDASLLQLPHTGIIAADDPRMVSTVAAIIDELSDAHGLIHRYRTEAGIDGLSGDEYPFLICNFWLAEHYARAGQVDAATLVLEQLVGYANDLGLLAEEYSPTLGRLAGNYPQVFSHIGVIRAVAAIAQA